MSLNFESYLLLTIKASNIEGVLSKKMNISSSKLSREISAVTVIFPGRCKNNNSMLLS